jgi:hypothetical protein
MKHQSLLDGFQAMRPLKKEKPFLKKWYMRTQEVKLANFLLVKKLT